VIEGGAMSTHPLVSLMSSCKVKRWSTLCCRLTVERRIPPPSPTTTTTSFPPLL